MPVASKTRDTLVLEVIAQDFDSTIYTPLAQTYLNEALGRIGRQVKGLQRRRVQTINTVVGTSSYTLPADFISSRKVFIPSVTLDLDELDADDFDDQPVSATGMPVTYMLDAVDSAAPTPTIYFWPTPSAIWVISHRYFALPAGMTTGTDVPSIPTDYTDLMVTYARARCFRNEDDIATASALMQEFKLGVVDMIRDLQMPSERKVRRNDRMYQERQGGGGLTLRRG